MIRLEIEPAGICAYPEMVMSGKREVSDDVSHGNVVYGFWDGEGVWNFRVVLISWYVIVNNRHLLGNTKFLVSKNVNVYWSSSSPVPSAALLHSLIKFCSPTM
jgi:hypothetical protein